jgi:tetratricopeptide (TPR) repeat protein
MGMLFKRQSKFERALDAYQRCLKIREENQGEDHPDAIAVRHNIAELYVIWAKPDKAKEYLQKNIEIMGKQDKE